jgi:hypothetical protein
MHKLFNALFVSIISLVQNENICMDFFLKYDAN